MSSKAPLSFHGTKFDARLSPETQAKLRQASAGAGAGMGPRPGLTPPKFKDKKREGGASQTDATKEGAKEARPKTNKPSKKSSPDANDTKRQKTLLGILCAILIPALLMML